VTVAANVVEEMLENSQMQVNKKKIAEERMYI
jgi:hypothetical protein